jgi:hypothetical protein
VNSHGSGAKLTIKNMKDKIMGEIYSDYLPQEIRIDDNAKFVVLLGKILNGNSIDFSNFPALKIYSLDMDSSSVILLKDIISPSTLKVYGKRVYWYDNEKTGFVKNAPYFQIETRNGNRYFINLRSFKLENYTGEVELFEMGWDH